MLPRALAQAAEKGPRIGAAQIERMAQHWIETAMDSIISWAGLH
jgi:hypothetical protein